MKYSCDKCSKSFTRTYNLTRHQRDSCAATRIVVGGGGGDDGVNKPKQARVDGAASTSNNAAIHTCHVCDVRVPKNRILAHERTLEHRSKSCVSVGHGVQRIETAFKNRIVTYRITSENEHVDYTAFFDEIKSKVLQLLGEIVRVYKSVKVNMAAIGRYFLPTQEITSEKSFNTANEIVSMGCDLDDVYRSFMEVMKVQTADFQEKDSGMLRNVK